MKINLWKKQVKIRNECKRITEQARTDRVAALKMQTKKMMKKEEEETQKKKKKEEEEKKKTVVLKIQVFSDVTPCLLVNGYRCLRRQ
jgi:hypothetical protein